jgi:hypothetical protein
VRCRWQDAVTRAAWDEEGSGNIRSSPGVVAVERDGALDKGKLKETLQELGAEHAPFLDEPYGNAVQTVPPRGRPAPLSARLVEINVSWGISWRLLGVCVSGDLDRGCR